LREQKAKEGGFRDPSFLCGNLPLHCVFAEGDDFQMVFDAEGIEFVRSADRYLS
jgi:hypothetical protein